ncbi:MAG: glycosyltransferase family 2 protein [Chloroflexi bacterium]|nr:glycosyltransferase family 2 protein [Chloroflexota bacterium]
MLVSVIIPTWNGAHLLGACLDSLRRQTYQPLEVVVVDGGSRDGTVEMVSRCYPEVLLVPLPRNLGFTGNVNAGLRAARGEALGLLNNDAEADPAWVELLVHGLSAGPRVGSCASKMLYADRRDVIASAGDVLRRDGLAAQRGNGSLDDGRFDAPGPVFAASGGAVLYRGSMLEDVGLLDERFVSYLEDVDLGFRAQLRGWTCQYVPGARVYHRVSATGGGPLASYFVARNTLRLIAKDFPLELLARAWTSIVRAQRERARDALGAWRGAAARATLRGQVAGLVEVPLVLRHRRQTQRRRLASLEHLWSLLEDC